MKPSRLIERPVLVEAEESRAGLPGCGRGVTVPISTKPKPSRSIASGDPRVLVEPGGDADRVRKIAAPQALRQDRRIGRPLPPETRRERAQGQPVRRFGRQARNSGAASGKRLGTVQKLSSTVTGV